MYKALCVISFLFVSAFSQEDSEPLFITKPAAQPSPHDGEEQQQSPAAPAGAGFQHSSQAITGTLKVHATPADAVIFINGKHVGNGTLTRDLPTGKYDVYVGYKQDSESQTIYIVEGKVHEMSVSLGKDKVYSITSLFSQIWVNGRRAYGPAAHLEIESGKNVYGISFNWTLRHDDDDSRGRGESIGGAAFSWHYKALRYKDIISLSPGCAGGFWYFYGHTIENFTVYLDSTDHNFDYYGPEYEDYYFFHESSLLFGGPFVDFSAGYGRLYLDIRYTLLLGNAVGHVLKTGLRVTL